MLIRVRHGSPYERIKAVTGSLRDIHASRAERWFGADLYDRLLRVNHYWPIPVLGAAGPVYAYRGSLLGQSWGGQFASMLDCARDVWRRAARPSSTLCMGFASLADLRSEAWNSAGSALGGQWGKYQFAHFHKSVSLTVAGVTASMARTSGIPAGNATAAAFGAGESPDGSTATPAGLSPLMEDAPGGETKHLAGATFSVSSTSAHLCLLYDRFYQGNWNVATTPQAVTGTPTRYQDTTSKGAFVSAEVSTVLGAATAALDLTYVDQDGNAAEATATDPTTIASCPVDRAPWGTAAIPDWHWALNAGDTGVRAITNLAAGAAITGNLNVFIGWPIVLLPTPSVTDEQFEFNCINSMFNMRRLYDKAALQELAIWQSTTSARIYRATYRFGIG